MQHVDMGESLLFISKWPSLCSRGSRTSLHSESSVRGFEVISKLCLPSYGLYGRKSVHLQHGMSILIMLGLMFFLWMASSALGIMPLSTHHFLRGAPSIFLPSVQPMDIQNPLCIKEQWHKWFSHIVLENCFNLLSGQERFHAVLSENDLIHILHWQGKLH